MKGNKGAEMSKEQKNKCEGTALQALAHPPGGVGTGTLLQELEARSQTSCTPRDDC